MKNFDFPLAALSFKDASAVVLVSCGSLNVREQLIPCQYTAVASSNVKRQVYRRHTLRPKF
eukprot:6194039-Pleurochrysis_carterae.AAC.1